MPTAHNAGIDLAWECSGSGPRLLVLIGSGSTLEESRDLLGLVAGGATHLAFDYRGLGASGPAPTPYGMAECAADALAVMDAAGWDTARVIGISFGGMVAQELAVTAPERVERLVLACTSAGGAGGSSYPLHELLDLDPGERAARAATLLDSRFDEPWLEAHPNDRALVTYMGRRQADVGPVEAAARRAQLDARRGHDVWDRLPAVHCPTLVACGRFDPIAPMANSQAIASRIAGSELSVYDGGHPFVVQDPAALPDIRAFLLTEGP